PAPRADPALAPGAIVEADLAPGRPLHPGTWAWLLGSEGLAGAEVVLGPPGGALERVPSSDDWAVALNADLARVEAVIYPPASFAVVATRPPLTR
ncbi:MAG: hypothetical protein ACRD0L_01820, partial [Acidimicrobiales bacterium]